MARPKRQFTDEEVQGIAKYALAGCQNQTIAILLDIPKTTIIRRFGHLLHKKRSERRFNLRENQTKLAEVNPAMAIFLGKNELGQVDKQEISTGTIESKPKTEQEIRAAKAAAKAYNEAMSKSAKIVKIGKQA